MSNWNVAKGVYSPELLDWFDEPPDGYPSEGMGGIARPMQLYPEAAEVVVRQLLRESCDIWYPVEGPLASGDVVDTAGRRLEFKRAEARAWVFFARRRRDPTSGEYVLVYSDGTEERHLSQTPPVSNERVQFVPPRWEAR